MEANKPRDSQGEETLQPEEIQTKESEDDGPYAESDVRHWEAQDGLPGSESPYTS